MKKEIPDWMREEHRRLKAEWKQSGSEKEFYFWLLDRVETQIKNRIPGIDNMGIV